MLLLHCVMLQAVVGGGVYMYTNTCMHALCSINGRGSSVHATLLQLQRQMVDCTYPQRLLNMLAIHDRYNEPPMAASCRGLLPSITLKDKNDLVTLLVDFSC
jgi:hypothetical protein